MRMFFLPANDPGIPDGSISPREREIVTLVADGYSNKLMAHKLGITVKTVETHRREAKRKLGVRSTAHLIRYAILAGLVSP